MSRTYLIHEDVSDALIFAKLKFSLLIVNVFVMVQLQACRFVPETRLFTTLLFLCSAVCKKYNVHLLVIKQKVLRDLQVFYPLSNIIPKRFFYYYLIIFAFTIIKTLYKNCNVISLLLSSACQFNDFSAYVSLLRGYVRSKDAQIYISAMLLFLADNASHLYLFFNTQTIG